MNAETLFWLGMVMLSPAFYKLGRLLTRFILDIFFPDHRIVVSYTDAQGSMIKRTVNLDSNAELSKIMSEVKSGQSVTRGPVL